MFLKVKRLAGHQIICFSFDRSTTDLLRNRTCDHSSIIFILLTSHACARFLHESSMRIKAHESINNDYGSNNDNSTNGPWLKKQNRQSQIRSLNFYVLTTTCGCRHLQSNHPSRDNQTSDSQNYFNRHDVIYF